MVVKGEADCSERITHGRAVLTFTKRPPGGVSARRRRLNRL